MRVMTSLPLACILLASISNAQTGVGVPSQPLHVQLTSSKTIRVVSQVAGVFAHPLVCDSQGSLYFRTYGQEVSSLMKFSADGKKQAEFRASAVPDLKIQLADHFSVDKAGNVYQIAYISGTLDRYVIAYNSDGSFNAKIKLNVPFTWMPAQVAAFPSGNLLVAGLRSDPDKEHQSRVQSPFTGIFSADGTLVKTVILPDDDDIQQRALAGDPDVVSAEFPHNITAIEFGSAETGADGAVYLMRHLPSPIFYAISNSGEVMRRFIVDAGSPGFRPWSTHLSGSRIAVQFLNADTDDQIFKVTDLQGNPITAYPAKTNLGLAFACYSGTNDSMTFLGTTNDGFLSLNTLEPR